jgi:hypothetical protein
VAGGDQADVTGYVARLGATIRVAPAAASPTPSASGSTSASATSGTDNAAPLAQSGPTSLTPALGAVGGLLVLLGMGAVASTRRRGAHA